MTRWPRMDRRRRHSPPLRRFMERPSSPTLEALRDFMNELEDERRKEGLRAKLEARLQTATGHKKGKIRRKLGQIRSELIEVRERLALPVRRLQRLNFITVKNAQDLDAVVELRDRPGWGYNGTVKIYRRGFATDQDFNQLCNAADRSGFRGIRRIFQG